MKPEIYFKIFQHANDLKSCDLLVNAELYNKDEALRLFERELPNHNVKSIEKVHLTFCPFGNELRRVSANFDDAMPIWIIEAKINKEMI